MATVYPALEARRPASAFLVPAFYLLFVLASLFKSRSARLSVLVLLVTITASSPFFVAKNLNEDYSRGLPSFAIPIFFADLLLLSKAGSIKWVQDYTKCTDHGTGISEADCETMWKKFKWGCRLVVSFRLIGWNVQVKGVPHHHNRNLSRRNFVMKYFILGGLSWAYKLGFQYLIGVAITGRESIVSPAAHRMFDIVEGWSGALWAAVGLNQYYQLAAAISVGIGLCDPWEWPPFFGDLRDGWSVRQIWSSVWHQLLRRILQQPGIGLARALGLRKGTTGSSYLQLYTAFTISMLLHEWCMFNAIRSDAGELRFFMAQPLAITFEDFVKWCWQGSRFSERHPSMGTTLGYAWTFIWFSYCLPPFVQSQRAVGIMGEDLCGDWALELGQKHCRAVLMTTMHRR